MQDLIAFFRRFRIFLFFVLLQVVALSNYFTGLSFPRSQYNTSASTVAAAILGFENSFTKHWNLSQSNIELQKENVRLRKKIASSFIRLDNNYVKIDDSLHQQQYDYIAGEVINSSTTKFNNYFTINIGRKQGVGVKMAVFSDKGIIGIIHNTSEHFSVVKTVLTKDINIDVLIEGADAIGLLKWDGKDPKRGSITGISNDMKLKKWAKIVTRGGGLNFPKGLLVGRIESYKSIEGQPLWDVTFRYSENYANVQNIYVVKNLFRSEQEKIESLIPQDEEEEE